MSDCPVNPSDYFPKMKIHNHPDWKYHLAPGISSSQVKCFVNQSPRHYHWRYVLQQASKIETDAMLQGTLVHCLVLEADSFESRFEKRIDQDDFPDAMKTVPELKAYCEKNKLITSGVKQDLINRVMDHNPNAQVWDVMLHRQKQSNKRIVQSGLWDKARAIRDGVFNNEDAGFLFSQGKPEVSYWAEHEATGQLIKCRADWVRDDGICVDLKTCACSSPSNFSRDCIRFGYDLQDAHYTHTINQSGQSDCGLFTFVAVESEPPYLCQIYTLDERSRSAAIQRYELAMKELEQCKTFDQWPGYADAISALSLPGWYLKQQENAA